MILPNKIDIQIVNKAGHINPISNVIFGLKVFDAGGMWYNYSVFRTGIDGSVVLSRQQILDNTGLPQNADYDSADSTKFELYAWNGALLATLIESSKHLLGLYEDKEAVQKDLKKLRVVESDIPAAMKVTNEKSKEDLKFFEEIKNGVNNMVEIHTDKVEGLWRDVLPKRYEFIIE